MTTTEYIIPLLIVIGALFIGIIFEKIVLSRLRKMAKKTEWEVDDVILDSLRGVFVLWFVLGALSIEIANIELKPMMNRVANSILIILFIFSITLVIARIVVGALRLYSQKDNGKLPSATIFTNIARIIIFLIGALIILDSLGISITPILTALGVGGLAVALALQDTLSNLFSGIHILASRQIIPGNYVKLDSGDEGYIVDITWRTTSIRTLPNNIVIIPNSKLAAAIVTNYYLPEPEMSVVIQASVGYDSDLEKVEKVTIETGRELLQQAEGGVSAFSPFIRYHTFANSGIEFSVILRGKEFVDQYLLKHEFIKMLHKRYREEGIEIPFPQRVVHLKGGGQGIH